MNDEQYDDLSDNQKDLMEALTLFSENSEIEANEIIGYIEDLKIKAVNDYKQKVRDAIEKSKRKCGCCYSYKILLEELKLND